MEIRFYIPIISKIDHLFGTYNLLTYTYEFFEEKHVFISDRTQPPPGITAEDEFQTGESDLYWKNHGGGLEGLRQKAWTLITTSMLLEVPRRCGYEIHITGQGDNQVIRVSQPKFDPSLNNDVYIMRYDREIREQINVVMEHLTTVSSDLELPIKRVETWISTHMFAYGKEIIVRGAFLPGALKKIGRVFFDVNELYRRK